MSRRLMLLVLVVSLAAVSGCKIQKPVHEDAVTEDVQPVSRQEGIRQLPCFGCHDVEAFFGKKEPGVFSHERHSSFDVHCNQCHDIRGHEPVKMIADACSTCHSLKVLIYNGGDMGRVAFNHDFHARAFGCGDCHPKVFPMKRGLRRMKMDAMYQGKSCGTCHDSQKSFSSMECARCHKQI